MEDKIHVVALSKTGENGFPVDSVVEVAIFEVDREKRTMESVYDAIIKHETSSWPDEVKEHVTEKYGIPLEKIESGRDEDEVIAEVRAILDDKFVTGFDVKTDFKGYLVNEPWDLGQKMEVCSSISSRSSMICRFPISRRGDPELVRDTYRKIFPSDPAGIGDGKGAYEDAARASAILIELHERGLY
ncbi:MAG: hypothetical protein PWQ88_719 [Candidatus Methanomethylophilaceae archaeon]|nr:hypothetical protein [Candidatus Methanomethylophilaceae archaeon]MDI3542191.1 hypothetical protein [Candidatus Methanomethylophilaceae archaeon]HIJ00651.1 hypothetical protein [Candidatus Methanomethylophilaceae archaeon]